VTSASYRLAIYAKAGNCGGANTRFGHLRIAVLGGIAERAPNLRALLLAAATRFAA